MPIEYPEKSNDWEPSALELVQILFDEVNWFQGIVTKRDSANKKGYVRFSLLNPQDREDDGWYSYSEIFPTWDESKDPDVRNRKRGEWRRRKWRRS
jgi:hypothetical protein